MDSLYSKFSSIWKIKNLKKYFILKIKYYGNRNQEDKNENIIEGILDHNEEYKEFIREKIAIMIDQWEKEYGQEISEYIKKIVNSFCNVDVYTQKINFKKICIIL